MSREIKFRAWDREQKKIFPVDSLVFEKGNAIVNGKTDIDLMQYTGLKDKNGVEIYEGDVLSEPVSPVGGKDEGYRYRNRVIEWLGACSGYSLFAPYASSEVMGNIYENPELMEGEK